MTPAARVQAAIEVLDAWRAGVRADKALKVWGRAHRFAGSGDRAAIRDHVFDAIRCRRSFAALGGAETGRGLMIGALRSAGREPAEVFGAGGHGPAPLSAAEAGHVPQMSEPEGLDCPDWLWHRLRDDLGFRAEPFLTVCQTRAPVFVRVNSLKSDRASAAEALTGEGIGCVPHPDVPTTLEITGNTRRIAGSQAYRDGWIELQDAHSQAVTVDLEPLGRVLDYCAGAGGKTLALAALTDARVVACDILPRRLADLPDRAARAGAEVEIVPFDSVEQRGPFDLVLCDAPCSGSGTWRRDPEGKWALTEDGLGALVATQAGVLAAAAPLVAPGGRLVYVTCSVLRAENEEQATPFLGTHPGWTLEDMRRWPVGLRGDGFFRMILRRPDA